jgi:hypothetical protein
MSSPSQERTAKSSHRLVAAQEPHTAEEGTDDDWPELHNHPRLFAWLADEADAQDRLVSCGTSENLHSCY